MALSLLADYSSPGSESDSEYDGINVVIRTPSQPHAAGGNNSTSTGRSSTVPHTQNRKRTSKVTLPLTPSSVMNPVMKKRKVMRRPVGAESVLIRSSLEEVERGGGWGKQEQTASIPLPTTGTHLPFFSKPRYRYRGWVWVITSSTATLVVKKGQIRPEGETSFGSGFNCL